MMMIPGAILLAVAAQPVPEGVHSIAQGPETICGITAASAAEFKVKVEQAADAGAFDRADGGDRFQIFNPLGPTPEMNQWVFSKPTDAAYPMATCRRLYVGPDGATYQERKMRCDASRVACDAIFREFEALDQRLSASIQGRR